MPTSLIGRTISLSGRRVNNAGNFFRRRPAALAASFLAALACFPPALAAWASDTSTENHVHLKSAGNIEVRLEEGRRQILFTDNVTFEYAGYHMKAGRLTLDESVGRAWAEGGLHLAGPVGSVDASDAWMDIASEQIVLRNVDARAGPWSAAAREAVVRGEVIDLLDVRMTVCPRPHPLYSLHARQLSRESPVRYVARGVVPYFYSIPFFYFSKYTYELEKTEAGTLVPSRQGFEFQPGRGNFSGIFLKTTWRKKFLDRKLVSTSHFDYYSNPGPAMGEEIDYKSSTTDHYTFAYFTSQRNINHEDNSRAPGYTNRWRLWQTWNRDMSFGHFKSFVNESSDSLIEDDYQFYFDERRLREREINSELVFDRSQMRVKVVAEQLQALNINGSTDYRIDHKLMPGLRFLMFPVALSRSDRPWGLWEGWRLYGTADVTGAAGRDRPDRLDGAFGSGRIRGIISAPLTRLLSTTFEAKIQNDYHGRKIASESRANTNVAGTRLTFHRPWWGERILSEAGYSYEKALTNESVFAADNGQAENLFFATLRNFGRVWRTSLNAGYDFRQSRRDVSVVEFQTRASGPLSSISTIARYDPISGRMQSVYTGTSFSLRDEITAGLGFQTVHTDSEIQIQFSPGFDFKPPRAPYRFGFSGLYDAELTRWRNRRTYLTWTFSCIETTFQISKTETDVRFNFSFRLTGFERGEDVFRSTALGRAGP